MHLDQQHQECQEALEKLQGRKVLAISFETHNDKCWSLHIETDKGNLVMTYCKTWNCPVVQHREE